MTDDDIVHVEPYWYNEKDCLGTGSFGEVYKGHHDQNKTLLLAIKRIRKGKLPQQIVDKEIQIMQELSRPDVHQSNFVTLVDCVQTDKHVYLVMEYCNGGDLDHYLKTIRKMDEASLKLFLQQIASALKILKGQVIVHRDLKPANILLCHNGTKDVSGITFKIADFGLGRFLDEGVQAQTFCGTPVYMAPEIFVPNAKYDYKADLFSIGAIVYQCFTGTLYSQFVPNSFKLPSHTSAELQDLITRLLCKDPKDRINFEDFYNHPFIGMKAVDEAKKNAGKSAPATGASQASADNSGCESCSFMCCHFCMGWFRRTFSIRKKQPEREDKVKILGDGRTSPSQPESPSQSLVPKGKGAAPSPAQKIVPQYTTGGGPSNAVSPAAKSNKSPAQKDGVHAKGQTSASPSANRGFFGFLRPNPHPLNAIQEIVSTQLLKTLVLDNRDVYGIAHLDTRFYVLCRSPSAIVYHSDQSPFIKIKDFAITEHIKFPQDIASSEAAKCLYVTDIGTNCIWKVERNYTFKVTRWIENISSPHTLSVGPGGHIVTFGNESKCLNVYGPDNVLIHSVPLPSQVKAPQHAVETSKGNFIVSYGELNGKKQGVCEISVKGKVVCQYEHRTEKLNHPTHLAIDSEDNVFVVDNAHDRILQLGAQLKLGQILPSDEKDKLDKPFRICLKSIKGQRRMLVEHRINAVDVYNLTQ